jgi:hypothetical protein
VAVLREAAHNLAACPALHLPGGCLGLVVRQSMLPGLLSMC